MTEASAPPAERPAVHSGQLLAVLCLGIFPSLLDTTIVNVAVPTIIPALHVTLDQVLWVLNSYLLVFAVLLITAARLGDRFGQRTVLVAGLTVFTVASGLCGLAQSPGELIGARLLQGVGAALLTPQALVIISATVPAERRGAAFGMLSSMGGLAAVTGPTVGGLIVTLADWRWIFFVNVPIGLIAVLATLRVMPDVRLGRYHRIDLVGILLASAGLFAVVFAFVEGEHYGWGQVVGWISIPVILIAGVLILAGFIFWERRPPEPLLPLPLLTNRSFALMSGINTAMGFAIFGFTLTNQLYLQSVLGLTALQAGFLVLAINVVLAAGSPMAGRVIDRVGAKRILLVGLGSYALGIAAVAALARPDASPLIFIGPFLVAGFGLACTFPAISTLAMGHAGPQLAGAASGTLNTSRQLGSALGSAAIGALLQNRLAASFSEQAHQQAAGLPADLGRSLVDFFEGAGRALAVGRGQGGGQSLPQGAADPSFQQAVHRVFVNGYSIAMRPTLAAVVLVLLLALLAAATVRSLPSRRAA